MRRIGALAGGLLLVSSSCAGPVATPSRTSFTPSRFDYAAFRRGFPELPEPNYLPFMVHRFALADGERDVLVFCRWDDARFPLAIHVEPPVIGADVQDEFQPEEDASYVEALDGAIASWEGALPQVVRFRRVERVEDADLRLRLIGERGPAPEEGVQVLGLTPVVEACRVTGGDPDDVRLEVEFEVPEVEIYLADEHGLLPPDQIQRIALHELGHALGMRGHSPIPADLMFEIARDRRVDQLSTEDVNSFTALYDVPNGTVYARVPSGTSPERPAATAPDGPPRLASPPWRDHEHGFSIRFAEGWLAIPAPRGAVAVDGIPWDYEASFQVIVRSYPTIESYIDRYGAGHVGRGEVIEQGELRVAGRPAFGMRVLQRGGATTEDHVFVETGDGRLIVVITDSPTALRAGFDPWFLAMLETLEVRPASR